MNPRTIKVVAFDADDTLWENETFFREAEVNFCELMKDFGSQEFVTRELLKTELANITWYGYGIKGFSLSLVETALRISNNKVNAYTIAQILQIAKTMLEKPVNTLKGVEETLIQLKQRYRLVLATKGDPVDQWRKLKKSGLEIFFEQVEIMTEKKEADYSNLIRKLGITPSEFLMIGNTIKSDVLPLLKIGANAIHIPFHTTWIHEIEEMAENITIQRVNELPELIPLLANEVC